MYTRNVSFTQIFPNQKMSVKNVLDARQSEMLVFGKRKDNYSVTTPTSNPDKSLKKLVLIADTHNYTPILPAGDVLIHAGDLSSTGTIREVQEQLDWLNSQPHEHIVLIAGNHDFAFEEAKPALRRGRITYLENSGATVAGLKMWGSPVTPAFMNWAFNIERGEAIRKYWDQIPEELDVLITHGPPYGILDQASPYFNTEHLGCKDLGEAVYSAEPRLHVFGHIHGGQGHFKFGNTHCYNASMVNEAYKQVHGAHVVELEAREQ